MHLQYFTVGKKVYALLVMLFNLYSKLVCEEWKKRGVSKMAVVSIAYRILPIEVVLFLFCHRLFSDVFLFPSSTNNLLDNWHVNRQGAFGARPHFELGCRWRFKRDRDGERDGDGDG
jgi:hypothetical protein